MANLPSPPVPGKPEPSPFVAGIVASTQGLSAVSTGICPSCDECRQEYAPDATPEEVEELWQTGKVYAEPSFSWHGCDICGSRLGGEFEPWHAIDANGDLIHGDRACVDCVVYLANGDQPENW